MKLRRCGARWRAYQLSRRSVVHDLRTGVTHQPKSVFGGDLDHFIEGYLRQL